MSWVVGFQWRRRIGPSGACGAPPADTAPVSAVMPQQVASDANLQLGVLPMMAKCGGQPLWEGCTGVRGLGGHCYSSASRGCAQGLRPSWLHLLELSFKDSCGVALQPSAWRACAGQTANACTPRFVARSAGDVFRACVRIRSHARLGRPLARRAQRTHPVLAGPPLLHFVCHVVSFASRCLPACGRRRCVKRVLDSNLHPLSGRWPAMPACG